MLFGNVALAAGTFLAFAGVSHLDFIQRAVATVVVILAHVHVTGNAKVDVFHKYLRLPAYMRGLTTLFCPLLFPIIRTLLTKFLFWVKIE